jgi:2-dehydropantoate 2-reductase
VSAAAEVSRVAVVGGGAIGGVLAQAAVLAGHDVTLCVRSPARSLSVTHDGQTEQVMVRITTDPDSVAAPTRWVLLATKGHQTAGAAPWLHRLAGPDTVVVVVQNGVEHAERLAPLRLPGTIVPALTYIAARRDGPGRIVRVAGDRVVVPDGAAGNAFAALLAGAPLTVDPAADFRTAAWRKLLTNVAANPVTALTGRPMEVLAAPGMPPLVRGLLTEAVAAGSADGARLSEQDVAATLEFYAGFDPDAGTSMLADRLAGRPTEHDEITGAVVRAAERHGLDVPLNRAMLALLMAATPGAGPGVGPPGP